VPGLLFVSAAALAYGPVGGFFAGYIGAGLNCTVSFLVYRKVGGQPLTLLRWAWARRVMAGIDSRPIRTVVLIRTVLWLVPPVSVVFAMTSIRPRDYAIGNVEGLVFPIMCAALFVDSALFCI